MRLIVLAIPLLLLLPTVAFAEPSPAPAAESHAIARVPATVLEHRETVVVDGARRLTRSITWTVRVEDPDACAAGLHAPAGLDGASASGATVLEDLLIFPPQVQAGDTFTLKATVRGDPGGQSGVFTTAPDLPTETAVLQVQAASWLPLHVWFDPGGAPEFGTRGGRSVTVTWTDLSSRAGAHAVWSTWRDWLEPGEELRRLVDARLASKDALGRVLARDIVALDVASITERVYAAVALDPTPAPGWGKPRPATEVVATGRGTAAERAIVLISLLRLAGHQASPGAFRPASEGGTFPVVVPAPHLLSRPVVVIDDDDGTLYVDPAADLAEVPSMPASLAGSIVWTAGDLPTAIRSPSLVDGTVHINTNLNIAGDGSASWTATLSASGTASEWIRELLAPLDESGRVQALHRLARVGRPHLERFTATATGVQRPDRKLKITLSGHDKGLLTASGGGLRGEVPVLLAPALAAWLPPNVRIRESMSISPPGTTQVLAVRPPRSAYTEEALVSRSFKREGQRQVLTVEVERPYRTTSPAREATARQFLDAQGALGFELLLYPAVQNPLIKEVRGSDLPRSDRAVLEALLWWSVQNDKKATRALLGAGAPFHELVVRLQPYLSTEQALPWSSLERLAAADEDALLAVAEGMEQAGLRTDALRISRTLHEAVDPETRARALLLTERLQPPEAPAVPEEQLLWKPPAALLAQAFEIAPDAQVVVARRAELALEAGNPAEAETLIEQALERGDSPALHVLLARTAARSGAAVDDVRARIQAAIARAPDDADAISQAAEALAELGQPREAASYALTAARLRGSDPNLWSEAAALALRAGDAPTAGYAARHASNLDPTSGERARLLREIAAILKDKETWQLARQRAGEVGVPERWPPSVDALMDRAPEALYAILVHRDEDVIEDARLLALRAQLHVDQGARDEAARDAVLLATRHGAAEGPALSFAATVGRLYSSTEARALEQAVRADLTARLARMEYRLITSSGDAAADARALGDDPRANVVSQLASAPGALAEQVEGWPADIPQPRVTTPRGFRANRLLSAVPGVAAWSDPDGATAILRVGAVTGLLPPPLANLYTPAEPPLRSRGDGGQVLRLDGGVMPLFVAVAVDGDQEVWGVGFTPEAAERALDAALP